MRQFGGYKREFWSSDYASQSTRSDAPHSSVFSHPVRKVPRGSSPPSRTSFRDAPVRRMSSDARIDVRRGGIGFKNHAAMAARGGQKMHKNYDDLLEGRDGRGDSYMDENYRGRPQLSARNLGYEDVRDKPVQSGQFREMRPVVHGRLESGGDGYRGGGMSRTDWRATSGRTYSDEEESRTARRYTQHVGSERVYEESKERGHDAGHRIEPAARNRVIPPPPPSSRMTQASDRPVARPRRASPHNLTSSERRPGPPEQKATPAGQSSLAKKGYGQDLRPEEILVTRNYQSLFDAKDFVSKVLPGEERRVKIVRELSAGVGSARHAGSPKSQRSTGDVDSVSSLNMPSKRSMIDLHGDTDDRILNNSMR